MMEMKWLNKAIFGYKLVFLVYLLLAFNAFVNGTAWMNLLTYAIAAGGAGILLCMAVKYKVYKKAYCFWPLMAFILSYLISAGTHISYGITENVKGALWLILSIMVIYFSAFNLSKEEIKKEINCLSIVFVAITTVFNLVSITMLYWGREYDYTDPAGLVRAIGYRWDRLWGAYDDPNHGATITLIALFMLMYFFVVNKKISSRVLVVVSIAINYFYFTMSDSRTGLVGLAAGIIVASIFWFGATYKTSTGKKKLKHVLVILVLIIVSVAGTAVVKTAYEPLDKKIEQIVKKKHPKKQSTNKGTARKADLSDDYSNGRMGIWMSGLEITKSSPIIGVGYRNIQPYAEEHFPDCYLIKNEQGSAYDSMHNLEFDVLVSQGIIGIVVFIIIIGNCLVLVLKKAGKISILDVNETMLAGAIVGAIMAASTFVSYIFYVNAPQNFCFWLALGYMFRICQLSDGKDN